MHSIEDGAHFFNIIRRIELGNGLFRSSESRRVLLLRSRVGGVLKGELGLVELRHLLVTLVSKIHLVQRLSDFFNDLDDFNVIVEIGCRDLSVLSVTAGAFNENLGLRLRFLDSETEETERMAAG